jgi:hypothetical protein
MAAGDLGELSAAAFGGLPRPRLLEPSSGASGCPGRSRLRPETTSFVDAGAVEGALGVHSET